MKKKNHRKNFPELPYMSQKSLSFAIYVRNTHNKHDTIHRESPEPDITSLHSHAIERDGETVEEYGNQIYLRSWIFPECLNRCKDMCMCFLYCEKIGTEENKENPNSASKAHTFS